MNSPNPTTSTPDPSVERDYETYKTLLGMWGSENPIKTNKLQVLLAVNALLVSAISISGGFTHDKWPLYAAGALFNLIWTFSIGRTALFQSVWQMKVKELSDRYPEDPRFQVLETDEYEKKAKPLLRILGGISSRYYLLYSPFGFALVWIAILIVTRQPS